MTSKPLLYINSVSDNAVASNQANFDSRISNDKNNSRGIKPTSNQQNTKSNRSNTETKKTANDTPSNEAINLSKALYRKLVLIATRSESEKPVLVTLSFNENKRTLYCLKLRKNILTVTSDGKKVEKININDITDIYINQI